VFCHCKTVSVFLSAFTMLAISIDRYRAVIFPLRPRLTTPKAAAVIGATWLLAAAASLPVAVNARVTRVDRRDFCDEVWPGGRHQRYAYSMVVMALQYFLPLAILTFTYVNIGVVIWVKRAPGEAEHRRDRRLAASKRKVLPACPISLSLSLPSINAANPLHGDPPFRAESHRCPRGLRVAAGFTKSPDPNQLSGSDER